MPKYDAIVVLSGNDEISRKRVRKALDMFYSGIAGNFVLDGFNTSEEHDPGFQGEWYNDPRLTPFRDEIEKIHSHVIHARNTRENAKKAYELAKQEGWKRILIVSNQSHIQGLYGKRNSGLVPWQFRKHFKFNQLDYVFVPEPEKELRRNSSLEILHKIKNTLENFVRV